MSLSSGNLNSKHFGTTINNIFWNIKIQAMVKYVSSGHISLSPKIFKLTKVKTMILVPKKLSFK